jgi:murein L,D-transpeptidase YcbB/YkuD
VNPSTIDWSRVTAASFGYRFRQEPGPGSPLGGVKFSVPNRWDVYLHDTSAPLLFERPLRAFSHGCMRLERPLDLAEYLLRGDSAWRRGDIEAAAAAGVERTVRLRARVPLHVVYRTVWVDDAGDLHFRADLYGHDARLARALGPAGGVAQPPDSVSPGCASGA